MGAIKQPDAIIEKPWLTTPEVFIEEHLPVLQRDEAVFHHTEFTVDELRGVLCEPVEALSTVNLGRLTTKTDDRLRLLSAAEHPTKENPAGLLRTLNERFLALQKRHHVDRKSMHGMPHNHSPLSPLSRFSLQDDRVPLTPEDVAGVAAWAKFFHVEYELILGKSSKSTPRRIVTFLPPLVRAQLSRLNIL